MGGTVLNAIRRAVGLPELQAPRVPFFGTLQTLLQIFGAGIRHRLALEQSRRVARRKGVSAGCAYSRAKGTLPHPPRRGRATGRGSYSEHDRMVGAFGAVDTRDFERGNCSLGQDRYAEMNLFREALHA